MRLNGKVRFQIKVLCWRCEHYCGRDDSYPYEPLCDVHFEHAYEFHGGKGAILSVKRVLDWNLCEFKYDRERYLERKANEG